jgi:hypothetical protein
MRLLSDSDSKAEAGMYLSLIDGCRNNIEHTQSLTNSPHAPGNSPKKGHSRPEADPKPLILQEKIPSRCLPKYLPQTGAIRGSRGDAPSKHLRSTLINIKVRAGSQNEKNNGLPANHLKKKNKGKSHTNSTTSNGGSRIDVCMARL